MAKNRRKRTIAEKRSINRSKSINKLFGPDSKDISEACNDKQLLSAHMWFINHLPFASLSRLATVKAPGGKMKGLSPKSFMDFEKYYPTIYARWIHLIKSCFVESYDMYQFFGAKGIYMSKEFLNGKQFCIWCLANGLTKPIGMYDQYLQRKRKHWHYTPKNCYVITEKELHECKSLKTVLGSLYFIKQYETYRHESVSYLTAYTRYYMYDMQAIDAVSLPYVKRRNGTETYGFKPTAFYKSVATEESCSLSTFISRMHYSYLNGGFKARPYEMLKPEFDVGAEANSQGKLSYKQKHYRDWKRSLDEGEIKPQSVYNTNTTVSEVYSVAEESNVYTD